MIKNFLQCKFIFNIILCMFQVSSIVVRQSYTLQSVHPNISSTHLTPYIVITILLTIFPMLYLTSPCLFCNYQSVRLHSFTTLHLSFSRFILPGEKTLQPTHFTYIQQCQTFSQVLMRQKELLLLKSNVWSSFTILAKWLIHPRNKNKDTVIL